MKITVIIPSFYPAVVYGGTIYSSYNTSKELSSMGNEVRVCTTNTNMHGRLKIESNRFIDLEGFKVNYYNETIVGRFSFSLLMNVWKEIRKADVIHVQAIFNTPTPMALFLARIFRKPVLLSPRGVLGEWIMTQGFSFKRQWLSLLIRPFASGIHWHATSEQEKNEILNYFPKAEVHVIPNGIDLAKFRGTSILGKEEYTHRFLLQSMNPSHILVSMGRLHKKKGFDILIQAFQIILQNLPDAILIIAGSDEGEKDHLKKLIDSLNLSGKVFIIDFLQGREKADFLANADLFVLPSHNENFGNVYLESLAAGTGIVASIHTPWKDVEIYGCGKWVNNSTEEVAKASLEMLKGNKNEIAERARKFSAEFSWISVGKRFDAVFKDMLAKKNKKIELYKNGN